MVRTVFRAWPLAFLTASLLLTLAAGSGALASPPPFVPLPPVAGKNPETAIGVARNAGGQGVATFLFAEETDPWAALVVNASTLDGVDRVSVHYSPQDRTLTIEVEDPISEKDVSVLVNKEFVDTLVTVQGNPPVIGLTAAVHYLGIAPLEDGDDTEVYSFFVTHFSIQTIRISPSSLGPMLPDTAGLTPVGWALVGTAALVVGLAAAVALRRRQ